MKPQPTHTPTPRNRACHDLGPQNWAPEPAYEYFSRWALYCIGILMAGGLAILALDSLESIWR